MPGTARLFKEFVKPGHFEFVGLTQPPQSLACVLFSRTAAEAVYRTSLISFDRQQ
jgi:hypothetical protein